MIVEMGKKEYLEKSCQAVENAGGNGGIRIALVVKRDSKCRIKETQQELSTWGIKESGMTGYHFPHQLQNSRKSTRCGSDIQSLNGF